MLNIIRGKAGSGKTAYIMSEIKAAVSRRERGFCLIIPEQYSHEAQRELCAVCGDSMSLYADAYSFTDLYRMVSARLGGAAESYLDSAGRLLCMALASDALYSRLRVYSDARRKPELQKLLLSEIDELKTACISSEMLREAANKSVGVLSDKLYDLSLLLEGFDAVVANGHADPTDKLTRLALMLEENDICSGMHFYIDGFTDFTAQERRVIAALIKCGADVSVCLSIDESSDMSEIFALPIMTERMLTRLAEESGVEVIITQHISESKKAPSIAYFADRLFGYTKDAYEGEAEGISLYTANDLDAECELAAARSLELVRTSGCRWRDIAIAVRGFDDYRGSLESAFSRYGVPLYTARKTDLMSKPLPALISSAYEIVSGGWELEDILDCLRTGLCPMSDEECDELENYALKWQLHGTAWTREEPWMLDPDGFRPQDPEKSRDRLAHINELRLLFAQPFKHFAENTENASTALEQALALSGLLEELSLSGRLEEKSEALRSSGRGALAQEYAQLWDITISALEQCASILGETETDTESFGRLFAMMLSQYNVGTIPAALDSVTAGDFDRMRRRNIKHLIVLGAAEDRLPKASEDYGVFSTDERRSLLEMELDLGGVGDSGLWREFTTIYNCLSLPGESLSLCYPEFTAKGEPARASYFVRRAQTLFGIKPAKAELSELRTNARAPALFLAANALHGGGVLESSAQELMQELEPEKMRSLRLASDLKRGKLSDSSVRALYGKNIKLSASRIDKFASCRFSYFMQYGLKAKPRTPAVFAPPEIGEFMHDILENVARETMQRGGFRLISDEELNGITDKYTAKYISEKLNDFREKNKRFEHLFKRLIKEVRQVVYDMAQELRCSDFEPVYFELDFDEIDKNHSIELPLDGYKLKLNGRVDRVDVWKKDGRTYLRIIDYKTGKKAFSLGDVYYGMGLQMLLYLFSLCKNGQELLGTDEIVPAGILYFPARESFLSNATDLSDDSLDYEKGKSIKRSGLILDDSAVIRAMEDSDEPRYIPVSVKKGVLTGEALASAERFGLLSRHIEKTLAEMAKELHEGSIAADPYYRAQSENACLFCDYSEACRFTDGENGECSRKLPKLKAAVVWERLEGGADNG